MNNVTAFVLCVLVSTFSMANTSGEQESQNTPRKLESSETFTYSLPDSFSSSSKQQEAKKEKDEKQREKLIEDIRKLYQANYI